MADLGKGLFNNPTRMLTGVWLLDHAGEIYPRLVARELTKETGGSQIIDEGEVGRALTLLAGLEMLERVEDDLGRRERRYRRRDSPGWRIFETCKEVAPLIAFAPERARSG